VINPTSVIPLAPEKPGYYLSIGMGLGVTSACVKPIQVLIGASIPAVRIHDDRSLGNELRIGAQVGIICATFSSHPFQNSHGMRYRIMVPTPSSGVGPDQELLSGGVLRLPLNIPSGRSRGLLGDCESGK